MKLKKLKPRKCRFKECRKDFQPTTEWNWYCTPRCRKAIHNRKRAALVRHALRALQAQERGAA